MPDMCTKFETADSVNTAQNTLTTYKYKLTNSQEKKNAFRPPRFFPHFTLYCRIL